MQAPILLFLYCVALASGLLVIGLVFLFLLFLYLTMIAPASAGVGEDTSGSEEASGGSHE